MTRTEVPLARPVPPWAALLIAQLTGDRSHIVTSDELAGRLESACPEREFASAVRELVRLQWLVATRRRGAWVFVPPGDALLRDPYADLRAWIAVDHPVVALAGDSAAWHLGYLGR